MPGGNKSGFNGSQNTELFVALYQFNQFNQYNDFATFLIIFQENENQENEKKLDRT